MRGIPFILISLILFGLGAVTIFLLFAFASRLIPTIWLPFTLAVLIGPILSLASISSRLRNGLWITMGCGVIAMWLLSEPETSLRAHPELRLVFLLLMAMASAGLLTLLLSKPSPTGWGFALIGMSVLIAFFSSPSGGSGSMISLAMRLFHISAAQADTLVLIVRKTIHFTFYGLLGWTAFHFALASSADKRKAIALGLLMALCHAAFDESRQTFFPNRTGSAYDVLLDLAGATSFIAISARKHSEKSVNEFAHSQTTPE